MRQPSIIPWIDLAVKPNGALFVAQFRRCRTAFSSTSDGVGALTFARTIMSYSMSYLEKATPSRRVLIVHGFATLINPSCNRIFTRNTQCRGCSIRRQHQRKTVFRLHANADGDPLAVSFDLNRSHTSARQDGPCRNRTYNLAIKSRLLCQLS